MADPITGLDSVVFETADLPRVRAFYAAVLGLRVGTCERDGRVVPDESERYVNFDLGGTLLCFECGPAAQLGTIVLRVRDLAAVVADLGARGIVPARRRESFAILTDPEGREIILQA